MVTVEEYGSGEIFEYMKQIDIAVKLFEYPVNKKHSSKKAD